MTISDRIRRCSAVPPPIAVFMRTGFQNTQCPRGHSRTLARASRNDGAMDSLTIVGQDRTVIRLPSRTLAYSLFLRLSQIRGVGQRGTAHRADGLGEVTLGEFPRRPEQVKDVLDVV